ncbi:MAG: hypothetical protein QMC37_01460, partial [Flavobacteriales bacterium]
VNMAHHDHILGKLISLLQNASGLHSSTLFAELKETRRKMLRNENDDARVMRLFSEFEEKVVELLLNESSPTDIKKQEKLELREAIRLSTIDLVRRREALVKAHNKVVSCWQPQKKMLCGLHSMHVVL